MKRNGIKSSFLSRITLLVVASITIIAAVVSAVAIFIAGYVIVDKSEKLALKQEDAITANIDKSVYNIYQMAKLMQSDEGIIDDILGEKEDGDSGGYDKNSIYQQLIRYRRFIPNVSYIAVLNDMDYSVKYLGRRWVEDRDSLYTKLHKNYIAANQTGYGDLKTSVSSDVFDKNGYSWNLYLPVYDPIKVSKQIGTICISLDEKMLQSYYENQVFEESYLLDLNHIIISSLEKNKIGIQWDQRISLSGNAGIKRDKANFVVYRFMENTQWYIVMVISMGSMLGDFIKAALLVFGIVIVCCILFNILAVKMVRSFFTPLNDLQEQMGLLSEKMPDTYIQMKTDYKEYEFQKMAAVFNKMVRDIHSLMDKIREEEVQKSIIELNALQSQIKPHFLYNTLECIHWQALMEKAPETSELIKELASFYRLSLDKGEEVVSLETELKHVDSYLAIQNVRYRNIIEYQPLVPGELKTVLLPRMTLQPLVENSLYHGIKVKSKFKGIIAVTAFKEDNECVVIQVRDNGRGMTEAEVCEINAQLSDFEPDSGYGIKNVHKRLELLYGKGYGLHVTKNQTRGITVEIRVPVQEKGYV